MKLTIAVCKEDNLWIARILEYLITQTGRTKDDAIKGVIQTYRDIRKEHPLRRVQLNPKEYSEWEIVTKEI